MRICDSCKKECKKTPFGSSVYICKTGETFCIDCISFKYDYEKFKKKYNILRYIKNREINTMFRTS
jgi:hypothetical protein